MYLTALLTSMAISMLLAGVIVPTASAADISPAPVPVAHPPSSLPDFAVRHGVVAPGKTTYYIPDSSIARPEHAGRYAHTNYRIVVPTGEAAPQIAPTARTTAPAAGFPPYDGYYYETPASLACIYGFAPRRNGCDPNQVNIHASGGYHVIAIVIAFHNPSVLADLQAFSEQFGLIPPNLEVVYATGKQPPVDWGWALESNLDTQWVHAFAPRAKIFLVEAASNSVEDLMQAEDVASRIVARTGGGQVSNSWGSWEFYGENTYDGHFATPGVTYFASTGDAPGTSWPSVSANVIAVGGTTTTRRLDGQFNQEATWADTGGGLSTYVPRPSYQNVIAGIVGTRRGVPDISLVANPATGAWVYCGAACSPDSGWWILGGTSLSAPVVAAMTNNAANVATSSAAQLTKIYARLGGADFFDVKSGFCGLYGADQAATGWDFCSGVGSPRGRGGL